MSEGKRSPDITLAQRFATPSCNCTCKSSICKGKALHRKEKEGNGKGLQVDGSALQGQEGRNCTLSSKGKRSIGGGWEETCLGFALQPHLVWLNTFYSIWIYMFKCNTHYTTLTLFSYKAKGDIQCQENIL